jgi:Flp pilus assembly protein CpaB
VDVILTQELAAADAPLGRRVVGETVLTDRRVIAVDQTIAQGPAGGETGPGRIARTVTLEVTMEQAERLAVASRLGRLSLTVRPIEKGLLPVSAPAGPIFGSDVSNALSGSLVSEGARMRVIQGTDVTTWCSGEGAAPPARRGAAPARPCAAQPLLPPTAGAARAPSRRRPPRRQRRCRR